MKPDSTTLHNQADNLEAQGGDLWIPGSLSSYEVDELKENLAKTIPIVAIDEPRF